MDAGRQASWARTAWNLENCQGNRAFASSRNLNKHSVHLESHWKIDDESSCVRTSRSWGRVTHVSNARDLSFLHRGVLGVLSGH